MPDHYHPGVFIGMADLCSAPSDTVHYFYSTNWFKTCYGSNILDLDVKQRKNCFDAANFNIDLIYASLGIKKYLASPPITNHINSSSIQIQAALHEKWSEKFFAQGPVH